LGVGLTNPHHKKTAVTEPQKRRPRPDKGCRAIGWMENYNVSEAEFCFRLQAKKKWGREARKPICWFPVELASDLDVRSV
jgi:hypothetical protein